jgi:bifunctional non-homologous end joining protein LigD
MATTCGAVRLRSARPRLASVLAKAGPGIRFNGHIEGDGETVFRRACKLGLEGIVSKRKDSTYRSGRSPDRLKMKNSDTRGRGARRGMVKRGE